MTKELYDEIIRSVESFSPKEKTELVCMVLDNCCLHPCQVLPLLGMDEGLFAEIEARVKSCFEDPAFLYERLEHIPADVIRKYVNTFVVENQ